MRKVLAAGAAAIAIAPIYLALLARRRVLARVVLIVVFGGFLVAAALGATAVPSTAYKSQPAAPASVSNLASPIQTGWALRAPIELTFSAPMDRASVEAALRIVPKADVHLGWDAQSTRLAVAPTGAWQPKTVYTVFVGPGARSAEGGPLTGVTPAVVFTEEATTAEIAATAQVGDHVQPDTGFALKFTRPVDLMSVRAAFSIEPEVAGRFEATDAIAATAVTWSPDEPLAPDTEYTVTFDRPVSDVDGVAVEGAPRLTVRTMAAPAVVRFRPREGQQQIDPNALLSVRFTQPMDHAATQSAFQISGLDTSKGRLWWAENDTVLVFDPPVALDYGRTYVMSVLSSARSQHGVPIANDGGTAATSTFQVMPKPVVARPRSGSTVPPPTPGVGGTSTAPWLAIEKYYLTLLNCTHTGGWLQSDGSCVGYGSNGLAPYRLDARASDLVARPWAKYLASTGQLYHGDVGGRFAAAGYVNGWWAENLTWYSGDPYRGAIASIIFFQNEKPYNGGHYRNLMDPRGTSVGLGVWIIGGRAWYVVDFWGG